MTNRCWKICESTYLHHAPWLTVRKDKLEMPNGTIIPEYFVLEYPNIANVIARTKDKKFILVEQYRHGIQALTTELCGGTCKTTESPLETIQRELLEETGYGNGKWQMFGKLAVHPIALTNYTYSFVAENVELITQPHQDNSEDIKVLLLDIDELKEKLLNGEIIQPTQACVLWKYLVLNKLI